MNNNHDAHLFALYIPSLSDLVKSSHRKSLDITDADFLHRISSVLRLEVGEAVILFDQAAHCTATIFEIVKKKLIRVTVHALVENIVCAPEITFLLPLLKRDALEAALYALTEVGVNKIQLVVTSKSQKSWSQKDQARARKVSIAAAEQSKNFAFPVIHAPIPLEQAFACINPKSQKFFFDPTSPLTPTELVRGERSAVFTLAIGPEGDLTPTEKQLMQKNGFIFCALTPTILRASQAAALSAGIIRSMIRS
jgi:16S rRNA (uracil1498-N3)-methyltransferase